MTNILDSLQKTYNDNIATLVGKISSKDLAWFICIFIICIFVSQYINLSLSGFVSMIIAILIIYYVWSKQNISLSQSDDLITKIDLITPKPSRLSPQYSDLVNFLYNIRSFYFSNQTEFSTLILNIDNFIQLYEEVMYKQMIYCAANTEVAIGFYLEARNNLHSVVYGLTVAPTLTKRFHSALKEFHRIMMTYINSMIHKCNMQFKPGSVTNSSTYIDPNYTKPVNYFDLGVVPYGNKN